MAGAAADRAVDTVRRHGLTGPIDRCRALRDRIHAEVCAEGYDAERNTFTQFYGSRGLDAALLLLPGVGFLPWQDPRIRGTVDAIGRELCEDGLLRRYHPGAGEVCGPTAGVPAGKSPMAGSRPTETRATDKGAAAPCPDFAQRLWSGGSSGSSWQSSPASWPHRP